MLVNRTLCSVFDTHRILVFEQYTLFATQICECYNSRAPDISPHLIHPYYNAILRALLEEQKQVRRQILMSTSVENLRGYADPSNSLINHTPRTCCLQRASMDIFRCIIRLLALYHHIRCDGLHSVVDSGSYLRNRWVP